METARVKVDDLAMGNLPRVCVKTGARAHGFVDFESTHGGFQPWWLLLVLLGPIGLIALAAFMVFGRRHNRVGGSLPLSSEALQRYNTSVRVGRWAFVLSFAVLIGGLALSAVWRDSGGLVQLEVAALVAFALGIGVALVAGFVTRWLWVDGELDGSGRWVALTGVHWVFVDAVEKAYRQAEPADH